MWRKYISANHVRPIVSHSINKNNESKNISLKSYAKHLRPFVAIFQAQIARSKESLPGGQ